MAGKKKVTTDINRCLLMSALLQQSNRFLQFVDEDRIFRLRNVSFHSHLNCYRWTGGCKLSLTDDEPGNAAREIIGQVFPVMADGYQRSGTGTLSSGPLQIWLLWDVEKLEGNICSQTHLNKSRCLCASSSCLNLSDSTRAVSLLLTALPSNPFSGVRHLFPASTRAPASRCVGAFRATHWHENRRKAQACYPWQPNLTMNLQISFNQPN